MTLQKRKHKRQNVRIEAIIVDTAGALVGRCVIVNVSASGARLTQLASIEVPDKFDLVMTRSGKVRRHCEVAWRSEKGIGIRFIPSVKIRPITTKSMSEPNSCQP